MKTKKKIGVIITVVLILCLISATALAGNVRYKDIASDHWAYQSIYKMSAQDVIAGYEDSTVRADNNITQFEAICFAVRVMGLDKDTASVAKGEYLPFNIPDWDGAYETAVVAYKANLIDADDFSYNTSATRQWIAKLLVKIAGKEAEVSTTTKQLTFTDASQIGSDYLNYVKVADSLELLKGYDDGSFKPTNKVTRAEMAAFLTRIQNIIGVKADNVIFGDITAINGVSITISDGTTSKVVYAVDNSHLFDLSAKAIEASDLTVGSYVMAVYDGSLLSYLEICEKGAYVPVASTIEGTVSYLDANRTTAVITDEDEKLNTIVLTNDTKYYKGSTSVSVTVTDLSLNDKVTVSVDSEQNALSIVIQNGDSNIKSGSIHLVDVYKNIIIMNENDELKTYNMASDIKVSVSGMLSATTSSLKVGDMAQYSLSGSTMTAIAVSGTVAEGGVTDADVSGKVTIVSVDTDNKVINYLDSANNIGAKYYNSSTAFVFGNTNGGADDLISGEKVSLIVSGNTISKLTADRDVNSSTKGTLYSLDTTNRIIFVKNDGILVNYPLASSVTVKLNDSTSSLSALKQDMEVSLKVENGKVTRIEADSKIYGTIESVDKKNDEITVTLASGNEETFDVSSNVDVYKKNSGYETLTALKVGDEVAMLKNSNNKISQIDVIVEVEYTVVKAYGSNSTLVSVTDEDGKKQTIGIDSSVDLTIPGNNSPVAGDLKEGDRLIVTYQGYEITKAAATATYSGTISSVNYTTGAITLKGYDGNTRYFTFTNSSTLTKGSYTYNSISSSNLKTNDRVAITQQGANAIQVSALQERTATVGVSSDQYIYLVNSSTAGDWSSYKIADNCYVHTSSSTTSIKASSISPNAIVTVYYDDNIAYEIVKK